VEARLTGNGLVSGLYATGRNDGVGAARSKFVMNRTEVSEASFVEWTIDKSQLPCLSFLAPSFLRAVLPHDRIAVSSSYGD